MVNTTTNTIKIFKEIGNTKTKSLQTLWMWSQKSIEQTQQTRIAKSCFYFANGSSW